MGELIVIAGPTAVGKTDLTVELAKELKAPVVSFDSRQFYKELSIGTAKPSTVEMDGIKHYFVDSHSIQNPINAGTYANEAHPVIEELLEKHQYVIFTGGSGMYADATMFGLDNFPDIPNTIRTDIKNEISQGLESQLLDELKAKDPQYFNEVDQNNFSRISRALEVIRVSGQPYSSFKTQEKTYQFKGDYKRIILNREREELYARINLRVDLMMQNGLLKEVQSVQPYQHLQALQTVGYKEIFDYLNGETNLEDAVNMVKQNSRRYAKRQITWFKRYPDATWFHPNEHQNILNHILA